MKTFQNFLYHWVCITINLCSYSRVLVYSLQTLSWIIEMLLEIKFTLIEVALFLFSNFRKTGVLFQNPQVYHEKHSLWRTTRDCTWCVKLEEIIFKAPNMYTIRLNVNIIGFSICTAKEDSVRYVDGDDGLSVWRDYPYYIRIAVIDVNYYDFIYLFNQCITVGWLNWNKWPWKYMTV